MFDNNYTDMWKKVKEELNKWKNLNLSLLGRISSIKMSILPRFMFLFQNLPILYNENIFKIWELEISKFIWAKKKARIKWKVTKDTKERSSLGTPNLGIYYYSCTLDLISCWIKLKDTRTLNLEDFNMRYGWHGYLWYRRSEVNKEFKDHIVRRSLLTIGTKSK